MGILPEEFEALITHAKVEEHLNFRVILVSMEGHCFGADARRYDACEFGLKELLSRFAGSRHVGRIHAQRLQAAVERLPADDAIDYVDKFFEGSLGRI